jgi:hypothetical protein
MTPEEEHDYQEALRRIREAQANKSVELDLAGLSHLTRFPPELASLTSLQSLNLSHCGQLSGDCPRSDGRKKRSGTKRHHSDSLSCSSALETQYNVSAISHV